MNNATQINYITPVQVARWLVEFGRDWVDQSVLRNTWADAELHWGALDHNGWLEIENMNAPHWRIRITDKAIALLKEEA